MSKSRDIADSAATINFIDDLTSAVQSQIDAKSPLSNPTFTGTVAATAFSGDGSALTGVDSLPSQTGNNGLFLTTDGSTASWGAAGGGLQSVQVFTASGTWTKPSGITKIKVTVIGGGAGGGGSSAGYGAAAGGGGGGFSIRFIDVSAISSETVTVGASGTGGAGGDGSNGGSSSFGAYASATGGTGGLGGTRFGCQGRTGGYGSSGDINGYGEAGGGGNGGSSDTSMGGNGGSSLFAGRGCGGVAQISSSPLQGLSYGAGGGGSARSSSTNQTGKNGYAGIVIVEEYA